MTPDIIGIDSDGNVCILEMQNVSVDAGITVTIEYPVPSTR